MSWIINFLSNRLQYVEHDSVKSTVAAAPSETIQGLAIGGIVFCKFIKDLCDVIRYCHKWLYFDDVKMVGDASTQTVSAHVQLDLDAISKWLEENLLAHKHSEMCSSAIRTTHVQLPIQHLWAVDYCIGIVLRDSNSRSRGIRLQYYDPRSVLLAITYKCRIPIQWKKIPSHTASCHSIMSFKKELRQHLSVF